MQLNGGNVDGVEKVRMGVALENKLGRVSVAEQSDQQ